MADDRGDVRRADEPPRPGGPVRRRHAEALVGEQHDAHVRRFLASCWSPGCCGRFKMGFGSADRKSGKGFFDTFWGKSGTVLSAGALAGSGRRSRRSRKARRSTSRQSSLVYFQFVFAAITPILMLGSVLGRINFKAWIPFVLLWITFVLHGQRVPDLGRRLLVGARRARLLRWVRHPPRGRDLRLRRGGGDRAAAATRPRDRRAQQPADGRGRRRAAVARLERLQRRRLLLRGRQRLGGGRQHQPVHGRGDARVDRAGTTSSATSRR